MSVFLASPPRRPLSDLTGGLGTLWTNLDMRRRAGMAPSPIDRLKPPIPPHLAGRPKTPAPNVDTQGITQTHGIAPLKFIYLMILVMTFVLAACEAKMEVQTTAAAPGSDAGEPPLEDATLPDETVDDQDDDEPPGMRAAKL